MDTPQNTVTIRTPMQKVTSSNIASVGYRTETGTLFVKFKNNTLYSYANVPAELHAAFLAAESKGSFFAKNIRSRFPTTKELISLLQDQEETDGKE